MLDKDLKLLKQAIEANSNPQDFQHWVNNGRVPEYGLDVCGP